MSAAAILSIILACHAAGADAAATVSAATTDDNGFLIHRVESPFEAGTTQIEVLKPDRMASDRRYAVIYVLPVEDGTGDRYGDGLLEVKKHDLHNAHQVIFVAPTFSHVPWYADHPTDPHIRQESYFLDVVIPFVDKNYPVVAEPRGRLLLGFSKSGWGAWTLLLRHPEVFGRAAAWDSPMTMDRFGAFGSGAIFGTPENFEKYSVPKLLAAKAAALGDEKRLILMGHGNFPQGHEQVHAQLDALKIPHAYREGPPRKHDWHSGWVSEAVELLLGKAE
jgi:S-formylglutathione hydrolase FrmB